MVQSAMFDGGVSASVTGGEAAGVEVGVKGNGTISSQVRTGIKKFWGVLYGGNSSQTLTTYNDVTAFHQAFKNYLTSSSATTFGRNTGALPISFSLKRISDGAIIGVRSIGSFDEKVECNTNSFTVDVNFTGFTVNKVGVVFSKAVSPVAALQVNKFLSPLAQSSIIVLEKCPHIISSWCF